MILRIGRRAARALAAVVLAVALVNGRVDGLRAGHVCPMAASHQAEPDAADEHAGHHAPADAPTPDHGDCSCEGPGCCPPSVAGLPSDAIRAAGVVQWPASSFQPAGQSAAPDIPLRGTVSARAPPILL